MNTRHFLASCAIAMTLAGPAAATVVAGRAAPPAPAAKTTTTPAAAASRASAAAILLRAGAITAVSADGTQVQIDSVWYKSVAGTTRVYHRGAELTTDVLAQGVKVRYTIASGTGASATLGAVYLP
jgi:hypothetical protein